ncbi:nitroreductase [Gordonia sp. (in: high G+C Gram-positive bacteria)]|uniref:nitroreductase n=1 Tax=Gordonia sp. (in: high G+C Gram-positive bacteria) TaxID=84139 RepID=UPI0039E2E4A5
MIPTAACEQAAAFDGLLAARHSCRAFAARQVPREEVVALLETAQRAPSWCNTQPWQVILTSGAATDRLREALYAHVLGGAPEVLDFDGPEQYTGVYRERRRTAGWQLYEAVGVRRGDRVASAHQAAENFRFFGAPHVALITTDAEQRVYGAVDAGLYAATFLYAAQSRGIAAIPQAAVAMQSPFLREYFQIPSDRKILMAISFGYADEDHPANGYRTSRAPLSEVVTFVDG